MITLYVIRTAPGAPIIGVTTIEYDAMKVCIEQNLWYDPLPVRVR